MWRAHTLTHFLYDLTTHKAWRGVTSTSGTLSMRISVTTPAIRHVENCHVKLGGSSKHAHAVKLLGFVGAMMSCNIATL